MRIFFDECLGPKWFRQFAEMLARRKTPVEAVHLLDKLKSGMKDDELGQWLAAQSPPFLVVSRDNGRNTRSSEPRLHRILPEQNITSVFVSRSLCLVDGFEQVRMMMVCWPELEDCYNGPRGLRYRLRKRPTGHLYHIERWDVPSSGSALNEH